MPKVIEPTLRQKIAVQELAKGKTGKDALLAAGYSEHTADNPGRILNSPSFQMIAEEYGLTDEAIIKPIHRALNAKAKFYNKRTARLEESDIDDFDTQLKAAHLGAKLRGTGEINKTHSESKNISIEVKGNDTSENIIANLLFQANRTKDLKAQA